MIDSMPPGMITFNQGVLQMACKITISLPAPLLAVLDKLTEEWKTTRSGAIANLLQQVKQKELEKELAEGYAALAEDNRRDAELFFPAQAEVVFRERN
ncbi:MAG: CopG family transcriptional regulator [Peptococcaceae bacterium]|nr:CopG family transcriptional regulator [Peptococcaceae bacterium]